MTSDHASELIAFTEFFHIFANNVGQEHERIGSPVIALLIAA
jgi:hypothetical protein